MKVRLDIGKARYEEVLKELTELGIGIDDEADLVLSEWGDYPEFLSGRTEDGTSHIAVADILYIESLGHDVLLHVLESGGDAVYKSRIRLRDYERMLDPEKFIRISNSVIVARDRVKHIRSALSQKFTLTLEGGARVDVTRSYYYTFRNAFGI